MSGTQGNGKRGVTTRLWVHSILALLFGVVLLGEITRMGLPLWVAGLMTGLGLALGLWKARSMAVSWDEEAHDLVASHDGSGKYILILFLVVRFGAGSVFKAFEPGVPAAAFGSVTAFIFGYVATKAVTLALAIRQVRRDAAGGA